MATATSPCPNCGAPIEFALGASLCKVCEYCRHTVVRSDRGLEGLGRVADLALTPSLIAVGDAGTLGEQTLRVLGRVQLDHGLGPWDEYFIALDDGQRFAWLAYAQGQWFITALSEPEPVPEFGELALEQELSLAGRSFFVAEIKDGQVLSTEGEFQNVIRAGDPRRYADCWGASNAFATLDYSRIGGARVTVYTGWAFAESALNITALGPRSTQKVKATTLRCPNCGGDIPKLAGERAERVGCPYCGALSDIAEQRVISAQEKARAATAIPIGTSGTLNGVTYTCVAYLRRGTSFDGTPYTWEEFLLWSQPVGFRWLVNDPEAGWAFVTPVNPADIERRVLGRLGLGGRRFEQRNQNEARVEYVLGEVYWKCSVGETTSVTDFADDDRVLSREVGAGEVHYSLSTPIAWVVLANAFGVLASSAGGYPESIKGRRGCTIGCFLIMVGFALLVVLSKTCGSCSTGGGGDDDSSYRGTGVFHGGK